MFKTSDKTELTELQQIYRIYQIVVLATRRSDVDVT